MTNEKGLYSRQNFVIKAISILSNIAGSVLKASDDNKWIFRSCKPDKSSLSTITLLSHVSAEFFKKKIIWRTLFMLIIVPFMDQIQQNKTKKPQISLPLRGQP